MTVERKRKKKKRKESKKKKKFSIKREAHDERGRSLRKSPAIEAGIITQPLRLTTKSKADREGRGYFTKRGSSEMSTGARSRHEAKVATKKMR